VILGLRTALYPAPDLAAAKAWYTALLGQAPGFDAPFYVGFTVAAVVDPFGNRFGIIENPSFDAAKLR
jgi:catechol 2,3-dioxygenase-like lactoylglutathione lyase family enzyme